MDLNNILGVVLAGGKSQRFGQDKSQVKLHNQLLIDYILKEIVSEFKETLVIANQPIIL
jgi:molybdopterin-guanine dinucleotide biosynthesis protein A